MTRRKIDTSKWGEPTPGRECGDCGLCCKLMSVVEHGEVQGTPYSFVKPAGQWCQHSCHTTGEGCAVYSQGPPARATICDTFKCLWLEGVFEERHKPKRSRVVVGCEAQTIKECVSCGGRQYTAEGEVYHHAPRHREEIREREIQYWLVYEAIPMITRQPGPAAEIVGYLRARKDLPVVVIHSPHKARTVYYPGEPAVLVEFTGEKDHPGS